MGVVGLLLDAVDGVDGVEAAHQDKQHRHVHEVAQTLLGEGQHNLQNEERTVLACLSLYNLAANCTAALPDIGPSVAQMNCSKMSNIGMHCKMILMHK